MRSGLEQHLPYSFSRWTEIPGDPLKWSWFQTRLKERVFEGFDPLVGVPYRWSLDPSDTQQIILWTKDPAAIVKDSASLRPWRDKIHIHVTCNGWGKSVERGVPDPSKVLPLLDPLIDIYGSENVTWRISPVPDLATIESLVASASSRVKNVFLSFTQPNDLSFPIPSTEEKTRILSGMTRKEWRLCWDDKDAASPSRVGVCCPPLDGQTPTDDCGCSLAVDPFGVNEACIFQCSYCYVATSGKKKHNSIHGKRKLNLL